MSVNGQGFKKLLMAAAVTASTFLAGCGGGGGGDPAAGGGENPVAGGGNGQLNPGLTGVFWYRPANERENYILDAATGVKISTVEMPSLNEMAVPSRDGSLYVEYLVDASEAAVKIKTREGASLWDFQFLLRGASYSLSPDNKYLALTKRDGNYRRWLVIYNLASPPAPALDPDKPVPPEQEYGERVPQKLTIKTYGSRESLAEGEDELWVSSFGWLPDGKYIYLRGDGKLVMGSVQTGNEQLMGTLSLPTSIKPFNDGKSPTNISSAYVIRPNRAGTRLAVEVNWEEGPITHEDIWLADLNGGNLERVTFGGFGAMAADPWSPDDKYIMFREGGAAACYIDTTTNFSGCNGNGKVKYVPSTARNALTFNLPTLERMNITPVILDTSVFIYWTQR